MTASAHSTLTALADAVGTDRVAPGPADGGLSTERWPGANLAGDSGPVLAVVRPEAEAEVAAEVGVAAGLGIPVIPAGARTGVVGGTLAVQPSIWLDLRGLNAIAVDGEDLRVTAGAGATEAAVDAALGERGLTLGRGHHAASEATIGGMVATRSAGAHCAAMGPAADAVLGLRGVTAAGEVIETGMPGGVDWTPALVGAEGRLLVVTSATLRALPRPEHTVYRRYRFRTLEAALRGARLLAQSGLRPWEVRVHDPLESLIQGTGDASFSALGALARPIRDFLRDPGGRTTGRAGRMALMLALGSPAALNSVVASLPVSSLLTVGFAGSRARAERDLQQAGALLGTAGAVDGGECGAEDPARGGYPLAFGDHGPGVLADLLDVSCTWSRVGEVHRAVTEALTPLCLVSARFEHMSAVGCSISFIVIGGRRDPRLLRRLADRIVADGLSAALAAGGTAAHRHGVGRARREQMRRQHGAGIRLIEAIHAALDPDERLNPGKLLPDRAVIA